ncbi:hypothetical protein U1Q18_034943 [Sarracenia purpurea var. burkii]
MNSYASCGTIADAEQIFHQIPCKNVVSWTILISGYAKNHLFAEAIEVFRQMITNGLLPNEITISSILPAFGKLGLTQIGKSVHSFWIRRGSGSNIFVETALVCMYSKFGWIDIARQLFDSMSERNGVSWNAIISCYSDNGFVEEGFSLFNLMRREGFSVDCFTMMSLISAASRIEGSWVGVGIHSFTIRTGFKNDQLVGRLNDAYSLVKSMTLNPDSEVYCALLSACKVHGNIELGIEISEKLFQLEPNDPGYYVLLSNLYALSGDSEGVKMTQVLLRSKGLKKDPGFSLIELNGELYTSMTEDLFVLFDTSDVVVIGWIFSVLLRFLRLHLEQERIAACKLGISLWILTEEGLGSFFAGFWLLKANIKINFVHFCFRWREKLLAFKALTD